MRSLCVRDKKEASLMYPRFPDRFVYLTLDISDNTVSLETMW
jgi:serine/threonine/tyrosine-interacting protein